MRARWEGADVVTARAVAPLARLVGWALPLLRPGGVAAGAQGRVGARRGRQGRVAVRTLGGSRPADRAMRCGSGRSTEHRGGRGASARIRPTTRHVRAVETDPEANGPMADARRDTQCVQRPVFHVKPMFAWNHRASGRRSRRRPRGPPRCSTRTGTSMPRPLRPEGADGREPEGRRRQDDEHRQHRGGARPARRAGARRRPRSAGQREHRAGRRAPVGHAFGLRAPARRADAAARRWRGVRRRRTCGASPPRSTSPARRSSWSRWWPASSGSSRP